MTAVTRTTRRASPRRTLSSASYAIVGTVLALGSLLPMLYIALRSVLPASADADGIGPRSLLGATAENYARIFSPEIGIGQFILNSTIVALGTAVGVIVVATLAAYGLSRLRLPFAELIFFVILGPLIVPYQGLLTPLSLVLSQIHLLNSLVGVILVLITFQLPFCVFVMRNTFDGIPLDLEEAARIDGASTMGVLRHVLVPLAWPGVVTVGLFGFMAGWNDLLTSVAFLSDQSKYTLPIALTQLQTSGLLIPGAQVVDTGLLTAAACVAAAPVVVLFLALQRYYTKGLLGGAIK